MFQRERVNSCFPDLRRRPGSVPLPASLVQLLGLSANAFVPRLVSLVQLCGLLTLCLVHLVGFSTLCLVHLVDPHSNAKGQRDRRAPQQPLSRESTHTFRATQ